MVYVEKVWAIPQPFGSLYSQLASRIATEANRLWAEDWDIALIVLSGRACLVPAPFLQSQVSGALMPIPPRISTHDSTMCAVAENTESMSGASPRRKPRASFPRTQGSFCELP